MLLHSFEIMQIQGRWDVCIQPPPLSRYRVRTHFDWLQLSSSRAVQRRGHSSWSRDRRTRIQTVISRLSLSTRTRGLRRTCTQPHVSTSLGSTPPLLQHTKRLGHHHRLSLSTFILLLLCSTSSSICNIFDPLDLFQHLLHLMRELNLQYNIFLNMRV